MAGVHGRRTHPPPRWRQGYRFEDGEDHRASSTPVYVPYLKEGITVSANNFAGSCVSLPKNSITNIVQPKSMCF